MQPRLLSFVHYFCPVTNILEKNSCFYSNSVYFACIAVCNCYCNMLGGNDLLVSANLQFAFFAAIRLQIF